MINNKPNTKKRFLVLMIAFSSFYNCTNNELLTFEKQYFDIKNLVNCEEIDCPLIKINLIQSIDNSSISSTFNQEIENLACSVLNINENEPEEILEDAIKEFNISYQQIHTDFSDEIIPYEATIDSELSYQNDAVISILMDSYIFTGGAHGYSSVSYINISTKTGKSINNQTLFKDKTDFLKYAETAFRKRHNIPKNQSINSTGLFFENDKFTLPENIGFTSKEVILYYNPYEISSYSNGAIELKFEKEEVSAFFAVNIL